MIHGLCAEFGSDNVYHYGMLKPQNPRRDLLKGMVLAGSAIPHALLSQTTHGSLAAGPLPGLFDVRRFGAAGDGKAVDSPAIQRAIDAAAAAGGGTVSLAAGTYLSFSLRLKSRVHLYLAPGSILIAADSPRRGEATGYRGGTYDAAEPEGITARFQDFGHNHWHNSLIWAEGQRDLAITGPGLIWGRGLSCGAGHATIGSEFIAEQAGVGNKAIAMKNCVNVLLRDFAVLKGGHFALLMTGVDNLTIDNLNLDTERDGMDIDCCRNVRVSNCTVNSPWDDGICPKSSLALGYARSTENLTIADCVVTGCYEHGSALDGTWKRFAPDPGFQHVGRIKCGTESNGGFRNIAISNCLFEGCRGFALETVDGALLEDVVVNNMTLRDINNSPIFLRLGARLRGPKDSTKVGTLRRVSISNVTCTSTDSKQCSIVAGIPGYPIEDLKMSGIYIEHPGGGTAEAAQIAPKELADRYPEPEVFGPMPAHGFYFRHVRRMEMSHVEVRPLAADARPAISLDSVERADLLSITAPALKGAFALRDVVDLRILQSRAAPDTVLNKVEQTTI